MHFQPVKIDVVSIILSFHRFISARVSNKDSSERTCALRLRAETGWNPYIDLSACWSTEVLQSSDVVLRKKLAELRGNDHLRPRKTLNSAIL